MANRKSDKANHAILSEQASTAYLQLLKDGCFANGWMVTGNPISMARRLHCPEDALMRILCELREQGIVILREEDGLIKVGSARYQSMGAPRVEEVHE